MPRTPRLVAGLAVADGVLTLLAAIAIIRSAPGTVGPFASIEGLLLSFATLALVVFVSAGVLQLEPSAGRTGLVLLAGLAVIDGLANGVFILAASVGFGIVDTLHWWTAATSGFLAALATAELAAPEIPKRDEMTRVTDPWEPRRLTPWPVPVILSSAAVGGIATLAGVGRYDFALDGPFQEPRTSTALIAVLCLILMALGAGAVAGTVALRRRRLAPNLRPMVAILATLVFTSSAASIGIAVKDVRDFHLTGLTPSTHLSWEGGFWVALSITLATAFVLGAVLASDDPAYDVTEHSFHS